MHDSIGVNQATYTALTCGNMPSAGRRRPIQSPTFRSRLFSAASCSPVLPGGAPHLLPDGRAGIPIATPRRDLLALTGAERSPRCIAEHTHLVDDSVEIRIIAALGIGLSDQHTLNLMQATDRHLAVHVQLLPAIGRVKVLDARDQISPSRDNVSARPGHRRRRGRM